MTPAEISDIFHPAPGPVWSPGQQYSHYRCIGRTGVRLNHDRNFFFQTFSRAAAAPIGAGACFFLLLCEATDDGDARGYPELDGPQKKGLPKQGQTSLMRSARRAVDGGPGEPAPKWAANLLLRPAGSNCRISRCCRGKSGFAPIAEAVMEDYRRPGFLLPTPTPEACSAM